MQVSDIHNKIKIISAKKRVWEIECVPLKTEASRNQETKAMKFYKRYVNLWNMTALIFLFYAVKNKARVNKKVV